MEYYRAAVGPQVRLYGPGYDQASAMALGAPYPKYPSMPLQYHPYAGNRAMAWGWRYDPYAYHRAYMWHQASLASQQHNIPHPSKYHVQLPGLYPSLKATDNSAICDQPSYDLHSSDVQKEVKAAEPPTPYLITNATYPPPTEIPNSMCGLTKTAESSWHKPGTFPSPLCQNPINQTLSFNPQLTQSTYETTTPSSRVGLYSDERNMPIKRERNPLDEESSGCLRRESHSNPIEGFMASIRSSDPKRSSPRVIQTEDTDLSPDASSETLETDPNKESRSYFHRPINKTIARHPSSPVRDIMSKIMKERALLRNRKVLIDDLIDTDPVTALDILTEECDARFRTNHLNDTVTANVDLHRLQGDKEFKDLEELISIDRELDNIMSCLEKEDNLKATQSNVSVAEERGVPEPSPENPICLVEGHEAPQQQTIRRRGRRKKIRHICNICGRQFSCRANKNVHMRIHSGEKPFDCPFCDKKFKQRASMSVHIRIHTGEKPYSCPHCGRRFTDYSTWQKHCRRHTGEKPYCCTVCNKSFSQSGNLIRHMKGHVES